MADLWSSIGSQTRLVAWLCGSVLAYAVAANIGWLIRDKDNQHWFYGRWPAEAGRFLYYLGIPYLALGGWPQGLHQGLLSLGDMGIVGLDTSWTLTRWLQAASTGIGWGLVGLLFLVLSWVNANRNVGNFRLEFSRVSQWRVLVDVLYLGIHWAFYRGALTLITGDLYAGTFFGLGLIYLEWSLNPLWRRGWRSQPQAAIRWLRATLALVIAVLFFLSRNLWICLVVHGLLELLLRQLGRARLGSPRIPSPDSG